MRPSPLFCATAALVACMLAPVCWGQTERRVSIVPERPLAGSAFVLEVILPGESAEAVVPLEPVLRGPARYTGADVHPGQDGDGLESAVVEYRFIADDAGGIDIVDLSARSGKRLLQFGSWSIDAVSGPRVPVRRYGSWIAPGSVFVRELFTVTALGPDGNPVNCPSFAVEGSLFEAVPHRPGSFRVVVLQPGILGLPQLELEDGAGLFEVRPESVAVQDLPVSAGQVDAVGGPWKLEILKPEPGYTVAVNAAVAWELQARGSGWPGLAATPLLRVEAPDGSSVPVNAGLAYSGRAGSPGGNFSSVRGGFTVHETGIYTVKSFPYTWFDTSTRSVQKAFAPAVRITVIAASAPEWVMPEPFIVASQAHIAALASRDAAWVPVAEAAARGDWATARVASYVAAGFPDAWSALTSASLQEQAESREALVVAATTLISTSPNPEAVAALAVFLRLEGSAFPAHDITVMADTAAASCGNLNRPVYVLPPFGWIFVVGFACVTVSVVLAAHGTLQHQTARRRGVTQPAVFIAVAVSIVVIVLGFASILERAAPRFVSLGGISRAVPSELAAQGEIVEAGQTGRVLESTEDWSFVELDEGRAVWLSTHDVVMY